MSSPAPDLAALVERLRPLLGAAHGDPEPLDGGITNRNFRLRFDAGEYVLRVPGKDTGLLEIDRGAERVATERAAAVGVGPEVATMLEDPLCLVTRFIAGRPLSAEELRGPAVLSEVAAALRAVHAGAPFPSTFSAFRIVETYATTAGARGAELPADYADAHTRALEIEDALRGAEHEPVPCHNDLLTANFLHDGERVRIVDWEYAGMGDRFFDLGNLSINNDFEEKDDERLLAAYFGAPATPRRFAAVRLMRMMSDFREAMWGVVQTAVSELDFDFRAYASEHFARMRASAADPRYQGWLEAARGD